MNSTKAQKSVRDFVWRWVTLGLGTMGAAMTLGRIPIELTHYLLHPETETEHAAPTIVATAQKTTVKS